MVHLGEIDRVHSATDVVVVLLLKLVSYVLVPIYTHVKKANKQKKFSLFVLCLLK